MAQCDVVEKPLLERIQSELEADPDLCDVTFSVGPQKTKVKALKIILLAASPVLKNEFKTKWENAVVRDGEGIPLPEFDGECFQLFVKLTSLDSWSVEGLQKLNLAPNQLLNLLSVCRRYEMRTAVKTLEKLTAAFIKSFAKFKDTPDFLKLSQENLKEVLASDGLAMEETEVLKCALKWAVWKCKEKMEASVDNLRHVLRDCLFEIRFPLMSVVDFTKMLGLKNVLTPEEALDIYKYIGLDENTRVTFDVRNLAFKSKQRNEAVLSKTVSNSAELQLQLQQTFGAGAAAQSFEVKPPPSVQPKGTPTAKPRGCSTLSLLNDSRKIDAKTPFVCDGSLHNHRFGSEQRVAVVGLGFAGPIDADAFYEVTVEIKNNYRDESLTDGRLKKRIYAKKNETFYFIFDKPITVEAKPLGSFLLSKWIDYSLTGPDTSSIVGGQNGLTRLQEGSNRLDFYFKSNQLFEILFNKL